MFAGLLIIRNTNHNVVELSRDVYKFNSSGVVIDTVYYSLRFHLRL